MTIIYDDFNRADASSLGANWTTVGGGGSQLGIVSNECLQTAVGIPAKEYWNANSFSGAIYAQCKISTLPSAEWSAGPALFNTTLSQEYVVLAKPDTILVHRNGVGIINGGTTLSAGDIIRLEFEAGTVTLKKNGAVIGTPYVDGSPYSPNRVGLYCYYNDSVPSSWAVDDFEGGDLEAAVTITLTDPVAVVTGSTASCTITRSTAASGNITYNLTSSNTGVATVPATATILDGQTTGSFNITGVSAGSSTITATNSADSGETDTATANVSALKGLSVTFGQTNLSGLTFAWFDEASPDLFDAPTVVGTTESTDGSGVLSIDLTGTSVAVGNTGFLLIYKAGATAPDDIAFFGRLTVQNIG